MVKILFVIVLFTSFNTAYAKEVPKDKKKLHFFLLDLHSAISSEVKMMVEHFGHKVTMWTISPYSTRILGKENDHVEFVNSSNYRSLNKETCENFYEYYYDFLQQFDAFLISHPTSFVLLFEKFNKPILICNPVRYECPFTDKPLLWTELNARLIEGMLKNKIFIVSNNKADQNYLKYYTGLESELIPSLGLYTQSHYTGSYNQFICHQHLYKFFPNQLPEYFNNPYLIHGPLNLPYSYQDLYNYKGIIHFPYQISTMSIFEQYSANIPLFFPSKNFLKSLYISKPNEILTELSYFHQLPHVKPQFILGEPNNVLDINVINSWIENADFYDELNMPFLQYFDSFSHLEYLLETVDLQEISNNMKEYNLYRKEMVLQKWGRVLNEVIHACD